MEDKKVIWITGASSGIGKALAIKFAENGWLVAASARRENLLNELKKINQNIFPFPLDVTQIDSCKLVAKDIIKHSKVKLFMVEDQYQLAKFIKNTIFGKKIVVGMGAGTISTWMRQLPELIK